MWQSQTDTWDFNGHNIHLKSYYWASASLWERYYINYWGKDSPFVCTDFPPSHSLWLNNPLGDLSCLTLIVSFLVRSTFTQEKNNDNLKFVSMRALLPSWQRFWRTGKKNLQLAIWKTGLLSWSYSSAWVGEDKLLFLVSSYKDHYAKT